MDALPPEVTFDSNASPPGRRLRMLLAIALASYWLVAFLGTHMPIPAGVVPRGGGDKVLHLVGYSVLASLLMGLRASRGPFGWYSIVMRWLVLAAYGAFDEITQLLVGRHADVADWYADLIGACCGLGFVVVLVRVCSLRIAKREPLSAADKAA